MTPTFTPEELHPCKECGHPRTIHEHYRPSGVMFARNTPAGRNALMKQMKSDTVASWCATKDCTCQKYKIAFADRMRQWLGKVRR